MPSDFKLIESKNKPSTIDTPVTVERHFLITSTREAILQELTPIFESHGYSFAVSDDSSGRIRDSQDFWGNNVKKGSYPTDINIYFLPSDTGCVSQPAPYGYVKQGCIDGEFMPDNVNEVDISWEAR